MLEKSIHMPKRMEGEIYRQTDRNRQREISIDREIDRQTDK